MSAERQKKRIADFFAKEKSRLVNYVRRWVQDAAERDGEDIVQDVMLNIFDSTDITAPVENLAAYVYRSLYNRAVIHRAVGRVGGACRHSSFEKAQGAPKSQIRARGFEDACSEAGPEKTVYIKGV